MIDAKNQFRKLSILIVSPFFPYPPKDGGKLKIYNSIKAASKECDIIFLSFVSSREEEASIPHLKDFCREVFTVRFGSDTPDLKASASFPEVVKTFYSEGMRNTLRQIIEKYHIDIIQTEYGFMAQYTKDIRHIPGILVEHDTSLLSLKWSYEKPLKGKWNIFRDWLRKLDFYKNAYKCFDKIIVFTEEEKKTVKSLAPKADISAIPIGVEIKSYNFKACDETSDELVFVGYMGHYPNVDGINYFCEKIFPLIQERLPSVTLNIVGSRMNGELDRIADNKNIKIIGEVDDIRPYLASAKVFVAPLRLGRGLRVKILEAMAMGLPVVATSVAANGIKAAAEESMLIADKPHKFAANVIRLLQDETLRKNMSSNARNIVEMYYNSQNNQLRIQKVYRELAGEMR